MNRSHALATFAVCCLSVFAIAPEAHANVCSLQGQGDVGYYDIPARVAKASVVLVAAATSCPSDGTPPVYTSKGLGFAVAASVKEASSGTITWLWVVTATHVVTDSTKDFAWACKVTVQEPDQPEPYDVHREPGAQGPTELERATDATVLLVKLDGDQSTEFGWPGLQDTRHLGRGSMLHFARRGGSVGVSMQPATSTVQFSALRAIAEGDIEPGDSGAPVFDDDWKIVGMLANEDKRAGNQGLFVPSETISLLLRSENIAPNLPDVATAERKYREDEWSQPKDGWLVGVGRVANMTLLGNVNGALLRLGGYAEGHLTNFDWPVVRIRSGVRAVVAGDVLGGYQSDRHLYFEMVPSVGLALFQRFGRIDSDFAIRWAPSILHTETVARVEGFDGAGFDASYRLMGAVGAGLDVRWLAHSGRNDLIESAFFTW